MIKGCNKEVQSTLKCMFSSSDSKKMHSSKIKIFFYIIPFRSYISFYKIALFSFKQFFNHEEIVFTFRILIN